MAAWTKDRITKTEANRLIKGILPIARTHSEQAEIGGSHRRGAHPVGDLDFVMVKGNMPALLDHLSKKYTVHSVPRKGEKLMSLVLKGKKKKIQVEFTSVSHPRSVGSALLHTTGSAKFNTGLRTFAKMKGFKLSQHGLFHAKSGRYAAGRSEKDVFNKLGMSYIPPEDRNNGFWEVKKKYKVRKLETVKSAIEARIGL